MKVLTEERVDALVKLVPNRVEAELRLDDLELDRIASGALRKFGDTLYKLHLQKNKLNGLPKRLFFSKDEEKQREHANLTYLDLSHNAITGESLKRLGKWRVTSLITLKLAGNNLESFPTETLAHLRQLRALVLNDNCLSSIHFTVKLEHLNTLVLSRNKIKDLGKTAGLSNFPGLKKLSIADNKLKAVPDILDCPLLAELRLAGNKISRFVNDGYQCLKKLSVLDLSRNRLSSIDDISSVECLCHLSNFSFTNNKFVQDFEDKAACGREVYVRYLSDAPRLKILDSKPIQFYKVTATDIAKAKQAKQKENKASVPSSPLQQESDLEEQNEENADSSGNGSDETTSKRKHKSEDDDEDEISEKKRTKPSTVVEETLKEKTPSGVEEVVVVQQNKKAKKTTDQVASWGKKRKVETW